MFGMSSRDFWENDPQLYWAYRFSFLEKFKVEQEAQKKQMQLNCWLQGKVNQIAFEIALNNSFTKKPKQFPSFKELFENYGKVDERIYEDLKEQLEGVEDEDVRQQIEFNYWARL